MKLPKASHWKEYPKYIVGYWLVIWFVWFGVHTVSILKSITPSGKYLETYPCLQEDFAGRFDQSTQCIEWGDPVYTPIGKDLKRNFIGEGILIGLVCIVIGGTNMRWKQKEEREKRRRLILGALEEGEDEAREEA